MRTLGFVTQSTGGRLVGPDLPFGDVSIDSRTLAAGALFFALRGERLDGHEFVAAAAARGAAAAVVDHELDIALPQVVVRDTSAALADSAAAWRKCFTLPLIGVGGSNGKTTTKEMLAAMLAEGGPSLATRGNLNNHIGVPLTLLRLEAGHRAAVVELGTNHPGEIAFLTRLAAPTVGLVTNAGAEHLEGFGNLEGVARAEGELFAGLDASATAVINADDAFATLWRDMCHAGRIATFGLGERAEFRATGIAGAIEDGRFVTRFTLATPAGEVGVSLALAGRHNVVNALGAAAAAHAAGIGLDAIAAGLGRMQPVGGRLTLVPAANGAWLIDDSYNANPDSVRAGIDVLADMSGRRWLVLGEMAELGAHTVASHVEAGAYARERGVERLFAVGPTTPHAVEAFGNGAQWFAGWQSLAAEVRAGLAAGTTVLVKGSRMNRLERVVGALTGVADAGGGH
jgi:UDP-N-acetylmuramoyl-tripeptide--D-alanyl-D-alanine ligase